MLRMYGFDGGTPLHCAREGIAAADPSVFGIGGDLVDLSVVPRWTEYGAVRLARRGSWYDLAWTAPADRILLDHRVYAHASPTARERLTRVLADTGALRNGCGCCSEEERLEEAMELRGLLAEVLLRRTWGRVGVLPAPGVIPVQERLEAAEPVTLEGVQEEHITLWGGPGKTLEMLQRRRAAAVKSDRTVDICDWRAWGRSAVETIRSLPVPAVA